MTVIKETSLLVEGTRSYPEALGALNEFGRLVISKIKTGLSEELGSLSSAVGIRLTENDLADYIRPNRMGSFDPNNVCLGVKVDRIAESGWSLYFVLFWLKGAACVSVSVWFRDGGLANSLHKTFNKIPGSALDGKEVSISRSVMPDAAEEIPIILRELVGDFSKACAKAGGLPKVVKPKTKAFAE